MGIFDFFRRKKRDKEKEKQDETLKEDKLPDISINEPVKFEKENIDLNDKKAKNAYLNRLKETIEDANKNSEEIKFEYGQVTSYLKDIQLIDQAPDEEKEELIDAARRIVDLQRERKKSQSISYKFTDTQKRAIESYEKKIVSDIKKIGEFEDYQIKIKNDMRQLRTEKNLLLEDKKDIIRSQSTLKAIGKSLAIILSAIGTMLLALIFLFKVDITIPFICSAAFALFVTTVIMIESRKNRIDMVITEKKCNRAVFLMNRVIIKYVNNVKTLDYMLDKYHVRNAVELEYVYKEYCKAKREWEKQRKSSVLLDEYNKIMIGQLQRLGVKDKDIWFNQAIALVNPKEMVEVRHDLNSRRQKLRDQIDYNTQVVEDCLSEIERIEE